MVKLTMEIPEEAFSALREAPERFAMRRKLDVLRVDLDQLRQEIGDA